MLLFSVEGWFNAKHAPDFASWREGGFEGVIRFEL